MTNPDILVVISDQHNALCTGYAGHSVVRTPELDRIAENGTSFNAAYTSYPQCVPARVSWLTGRLPSVTGIHTNSGAIPSDHPTFLHSLAAGGYETVLIGRMHFMGVDQNHGFTHRIGGDITSSCWGRSNESQKNLGPYAGTLDRTGCHSIIGGGYSPVLAYDNEVFDHAIEYFQKKHDKPQCVVVGTYAPHFSYVAPPKLYSYYAQHPDLPSSYYDITNHANSFMMRRKQRQNKKTTQRARAAYYGMIENLDEKIGMLHKEWSHYLSRDDRQGTFVYLSDHGDQIGQHDFYAKHTFLEGSARIPLIFQGSRIPTKKVIHDPVNIMDIGVTLCDLADCAPPVAQDGNSLKRHLSATFPQPDAHTISEYVDTDEDGAAVPARMIRKGCWKFIHYHQYDDEDLLFNIDTDPEELTNVRCAHPKLCAKLKAILLDGWNPEIIAQGCDIKKQQHKLIAQWSDETGARDQNIWMAPPEARHLPTVQ